MRTEDGREMHKADGDRHDNWCTCDRVRCRRCDRVTCWGATIDGMCLECWDRATGWKDEQR